MLARQAMTRWQFDAQRLQHIADGASSADTLMVMEATLYLSQIEALRQRLLLFSRSRDLAVRFETQETLVALDGIERRLHGILRRLEPRSAGRSARDVRAALLARRR